MKRKIIEIDEDKCTGCGLCVPSCAEGAIQIIDGKAKLVSETFCDGLGACLGECPEDALRIVERDADEFDEAAVKQHLAADRPKTLADIPLAPACPGTHARAVHHHAGGGCPGSQSRQRQVSACCDADGAETPSQLANWPVQLHLASPAAPYFRNADLLLVADCVPFAYADFHRKLLRGNPVVIGCPKLDDTDPYVAKLTQILQQQDLRSLTVAHMEVPCCMGLVAIAKAALRDSGVNVPFREITVGIGGEILEDQ